MEALWKFERRQFGLFRRNEKEMKRMRRDRLQLGLTGREMQQKRFWCRPRKTASVEEKSLGQLYLFHGTLEITSQGSEVLSVARNLARLRKFSDADSSASPGRRDRDAPQ